MTEKIVNKIIEKLQKGISYSKEELLIIYKEIDPDITKDSIDAM